MELIDLVRLDATALANQIQAGQITAVELVEATLERIAEVDPQVNAFRVVMGDAALADAARIDALPDTERRRLALAGVPIAIKDDTDVAGQSTTWGTGIDRGVCSTDAKVVRRLRDAGAIIIGKTNVPELTLWPWTSSKTWGVTRNPWDFDRTPGGSSGGSAAAVCSGMAAMALGSDGGGSIRYPAGLTGLFGLKPQRGRLPLGDEHGSGWHGLVTLGPLTRSVRDVALFMDTAAEPTDGRRFTDAIQHTDRPMRIALSTNPPPGTQVSVSDENRRIVDTTGELLTQLGHTVSEARIDYGLPTLWNSTVRLLKGAQHDVASLPCRDQLEARTRAVARLGRMLPERALRLALANERAITDSTNRVFDTADIIVTPLCASPAPLLSLCPSRGAFRSLRAANTSARLVPWNLSGQPALTVPIGMNGKLPTAVQLVAAPNDEATLLATAAQIEQHRPTPRLPGS